MALVIVTSNHYIQAEKIHSVTLNESQDWHSISRKGRRHDVPFFTYRIEIKYTPEMGGPNNHNIRSHDQMMECSISMGSYKGAQLAFRDFVEQLRQQMPDQVYLDKAMERLLANDIDTVVEKQEKLLEKEMEKVYDTSTRKVRKTRKTKGRSKALLRAIRARR